MNLDKKTLAGVSGVLALTFVLGVSAVSVDPSNNIMNVENYGIHSSAGANAAISDKGSNTTAGVNGAVILNKQTYPYDIIISLYS